MSSLPPISVLVMTYGRTRVLGECVESFLRQEYAGDAELVILNDHPAQDLSISISLSTTHRTIDVVNTRDRFPDMGTKRNTMLDLAVHKQVWFWDDDDIYLPDAMTRVAANYVKRTAQGFRCGRESHCFQLQPLGHGQAIEPAQALGGDLLGTEMAIRDAGHLWTMLADKSAIQQVGGFPANERRQDVVMVNSMIQAQMVMAECNMPGVPGLLRRTAGTPYPHCITSGAWSGPADNKTVQAAYSAEVQALIDAGQEPVGKIQITPGWARDYEALVTDVWRTRDPGRTVPRIGEPEDT